MKIFREKKNLVRLALGGFLLFFFVLLSVFLTKPILAFFEDPEKFRLWVEEKGWGARIIFVGMMVLQVVVALIPGEPLEIAAGIAFGSLEGTILVLCGIAIGSTLVFLLVRILGVKLVEIFFSVEKIHALRFLQNSRKFEMLLFLIMMIPGTPKDLISYFVGLTEMKLGHWILLTTVARIPSVVTSTVGGDALGEENYLLALLVFLGAAMVSLLGVFIYDAIVKKRNKNRM